MASYWTHHKLADPEATPDLKLAVFAKVKAIVDLPTVPAGTLGKVVLANGFEWPRYHVLFENGESVANLDGRHIDRRR